MCLALAFLIVFLSVLPHFSKMFSVVPTALTFFLSLFGMNLILLSIILLSAMFELV